MCSTSTFKSQNSIQTFKTLKTSSITVISNGLAYRKITNNAVLISSKQAINFQFVTKTIPTAQTICLNATSTYQTPKMTTPSAIQTFLTLRNNTDNAMTISLFPKTVYLHAITHFQLLKTITSFAKKITTLLKTLSQILLGNSEFAKPISNNAMKILKKQEKD
jgi:hypothetical protein